MTNVSDLETTIQAVRRTVSGDVCSRSRVVDSLLDIRLEAGARTDMVELIDSALVDLPGQNTVPSQWLLDQLDVLELAALNPVEPAI